MQKALVSFTSVDVRGFVHTNMLLSPNRSVRAQFDMTKAAKTSSDDATIALNPAVVRQVLGDKSSNTAGIAAAAVAPSCAAPAAAPAVTLAKLPTPIRNTIDKLRNAATPGKSAAKPAREPEPVEGQVPFAAAPVAPAAAVAPSAVRFASPAPAATISFAPEPGASAAASSTPEDAPMDAEAFSMVPAHPAQLEDEDDDGAEDATGGYGGAGIPDVTAVIFGSGFGLGQAVEDEEDEDDGDEMTSPMQEDGAAAASSSSSSGQPQTPPSQPPASQVQGQGQQRTGTPTLQPMGPGSPMRVLLAPTPLRAVPRSALKDIRERTPAKSAMKRSMARTPAHGATAAAAAGQENVDPTVSHLAFGTTAVAAASSSSSGFMSAGRNLLLKIGSSILPASVSAAMLPTPVANYVKAKRRVSY